MTRWLAAAAIALAIAVAAMLVNLRSLDAVRLARAEAVSAARAATPDLLSYDYRTVEEDFSRAKAYGTRNLARHYDRLTAAVAPEVRRLRSVVRSVTIGAGVEDATAERVVVLLFVNQSVTRGEQTSLNQYRVRYALLKEGPRWLVDEINDLVKPV